MANIYFQQHIVSDALKETLYFCSGSIPSKTKTELGPILSIGKTVVCCFSYRDIRVNGFRYKDIRDAQHKIMNLLLA